MVVNIIKPHSKHDQCRITESCGIDYRAMDHNNFTGSIPDSWGMGMVAMSQL